MYGWEMLTFNAKDGFLEGVARGHLKEVLSMHEYVHLTQCETLDDLKLHLGATELGPFLLAASEAGPPTINVSTFVNAATAKLVADLEYMRCQAYEPLATFLDYLTYGYMIDNVILMISGAMHKGDLQVLLEACHPLGMFENIGALTVAQNTRELYHYVLVDTPLAEYFSECLTLDDLDEMNIEVIRNMLYKAYLEDFARFVQGLGDTTSTFMGDMLAFEADHRIINLTINSIGTELTRDDRLKLFPSCGTLGAQAQLELSACVDMQQIMSVLDHYPHIATITSNLEFSEGGAASLDKLFLKEELKRCQGAFEQQFHYGVFHALLKIREQEIRNLMWICECIVQNSKDRIWDNVVAHNSEV